MYFRSDHNEAECAYMAGIIDSSSIIQIRKSILTDATKWRSAIVIHCSSASKIAQTMDGMLGVSISKEHKVYSSENPQYKSLAYACKENGYETHERNAWSCQGILLDYLIEATLPYLVIRKEEAILLQLYRNTFDKSGKPTGRPVSDEIIQERERIIKEFDSIKLRERY